MDLRRQRGEEVLKASFSKLASTHALLLCFVVSSPSQLHLVESTFSEQIIPKPSSESTLSDDIPSWVDRFLNVEQLLDPSTNTQRQALFSVTRLHEARGGSVWEAYISACEANNVCFPRYYRSFVNVAC